MSYVLSGDGPGFPGFPGGLPGPLPQIGPGASIFPTNLKWGDVAQVSGNFGGMFQGDIVVKFEGAPSMNVALTGPHIGAVVVPDGARTGACTIEVSGRQVFGGNCTITPTDGAKPREHPDIESWGRRGKRFRVGGRRRGMSGVMEDLGPAALLLGAAAAVVIYLGMRK